MHVWCPQVRSRGGIESWYLYRTHILPWPPLIFMPPQSFCGTPSLSWLPSLTYFTSFTFVRSPIHVCQVVVVNCHWDRRDVLQQSDGSRKRLQDHYRPCREGQPSLLVLPFEYAISARELDLSNSFDVLPVCCRHGERMQDLHLVTPMWLVWNERDL